MKNWSRFILFAGDLVALILFVVVGQRDNELVNEQNPILGVIVGALYFAAPYLVAGILLRAFSPIELDDHKTGDHKGRPYVIFFGRWLNAWLIAAPVGILIRSYALGRAVIPTLFIVAGLGFGALFMLVWRVVFALAVWWKNRKPI